MKRIITLLLFALCTRVLQCASDEAKTISGTIKAHASYKTNSLELKGGDKIDVTAQGSQELSLDVYVYADPTRELEAKSDDEETGIFSWNAPRDGSYYILLRNSSDVDGGHKIQISHPDERSLSGPPAPAAVVKVFYATDRAVIQAGTSKGTRYGSEPVDQLQFGVCNVSIPRSHQMGELEGPSIWRL